MRSAWLLLPALAALCALAVGGLAGSPPAPGYVDGATWTKGLVEPASVEILPDGAAAVADISADSVTLFEPDGGVRWVVSGEFDHPSGLGGGPRGLWVADSGNHRLVLLAISDGALLSSIRLEPELHPIGVCVADEGRLWVAASPEDRLLLLAADGEVILDIRELGGEPLEGPRGLAPDGAGGAFVAETLAGRVLHVTSAGTLAGVLGEWGPREGQFYKPKDVAVLPDGALAVVDSHEGIVQLLERDGMFRQLLSGPDGPLRFSFPIGISAQGESVYIADAGTAEVRRLDRAGSAWLDGRFPPGGIGSGGPSVRDEDPSFACRQCHDGTRQLSVGNWDPDATNHPLVMEEEAEIPVRFRLSEQGDLLCHTCHAVHESTGGTSGPATVGDVVDFGLSRDIDQVSRFPGNDLCVECHDTYLDTETSHRRKSHPIGLEPPAGTSKDELVAGGARFEGERLVCMSCHPPHGAHADPLLITAASNGDLCTACHQDHASGVSRHAVDVEVDRITRGRVEAMGGVFADNGHLACLSCHDPHQSTSATLLRTSQSGTDACRACHLDQSRAIRDGGHGESSCEECHGMHTRPAGFGDGRRIAGLGPQMCLDCHADGSSEPQVSPGESHPMGNELEPGDHGSLPPFEGRIGCSTCHEAHGGNDLILRSDDGVASLCIECHPDQETVLGTDHDARIVPAGESAQACLSCHAAHGSDEPYLFGEVAVDGNPADERCLGCHDGSTEATEIVHYTHPDGLMLTVGGLPFRYSGPVPYFSPDGERTTNREVGEITCVSCHDPHRWRHDAQDRPGEVDGSELNSFLRDPDEIVHFCEVCHGLEGRPQFRFFHDDEYRQERQPGEELP